MVNLLILCGDFPFGFEIELAKRLTEDIFIWEQDCLLFLGGTGEFDKDTYGEIEGSKFIFTNYNFTDFVENLKTSLCWA